MHHRNAKGIIALAGTFARPRHAVMGLPFLLLGLINLLMPLWVYRKGLGTAYAATTERVIIIK